MMRRQRDCGGASARKGDGVGATERRRGQVDGVGVFCQGGESSYMAGGGAPGR
jgi:hypothetical protein